MKQTAERNGFSSRVEDLGNSTQGKISAAARKTSDLKISATARKTSVPYNFSASRLKTFSLGIAVIAKR